MGVKFTGIAAPNAKAIHLAAKMQQSMALFMKLFDGVWKVEFFCLKNQRTNSGLKQSKRLRYLWGCTERRTFDHRVVQTQSRIFLDLHCALLQLSPIHSRFGQLCNMCCSTTQGQTDVWLPVCN